MACLKMPEVNHVLIAGNLTKDPVIRKTGSGISVINFCLASNHKYRDASNQWAEDVCYVGVVAWSKLADSCMAKLRKGSAVLVDGELQSRTWHTDEGSARTVVEIKAHRIQFLNKQELADMTMPECTDQVTDFAESGDEFAFAEAAYAIAYEEPHASGFAERSAERSGERQIEPTQPSTMELRLKPKNGNSEAAQ